MSASDEPLVPAKAATVTSSALGTVAGPACRALDPGPYQTLAPVTVPAHKRVYARLSTRYGRDKGIHCICIDPRFVERVWPLVAPLIRAAMRKGRVSDFADVERAVLDGMQLLWVAADRSAIWAAAVTELAHVSGEKVCTIVACGGRERKRWLPLKAELESFARAEGCTAMRIHGRRGWAREFPDYRLTSITLEKEI